MKIKGEYSLVLVTNYHVMITGLDDSYKLVTKVEISMKQIIEKNARKCTIEVEKGRQIELHSGMLEKGSCEVSPITSVCLLVKILYMYNKLI